MNFGMRFVAAPVASALASGLESELRLPSEAHTEQAWRIHDLAEDFRLEDVWALPTPGNICDFPRLVDEFVSGDPSQKAGGLSHLLWKLRWQLGELFGWDDAESGLESRVSSLRERLPADLHSQPGPAFRSLPFQSLYLLEDEFAAEIANKTVHGILHLGWVADEKRGYRGQMAVMVKPNGRLGEAYMLAIRPFRYLVIYPTLLRQLRRDWRRSSAAASVS